MAHEPILIVDDHPANLKLVRLLLESEGYEVRMAVDAAQALRVLEDFHPRLILLDVQLPGMDGLTLAGRLKSLPATHAIPILAITAHLLDQAARHTAPPRADVPEARP